MQCRGQVVDRKHVAEQPPSDSPDALRAFLWGKRQSRRHPLALDVDVTGALGVIAAMSMDVSADGVLLRIAASDLAPQAAADGEVDPFLLVQTHFRQACPAEFRKAGVKAHIEVVRLDVRPEERDFVYMGCRFSHPLEEEQLRRFSLAPEECTSELHALPSEMMPLQAAGDPCVARLYDLEGPSSPVFKGTLLGIGDGTLCMRVAGHHATLAAVGLGARELLVEVLTGDQVDWETSAWLQTIGFPGADTTELELGLITETAPKRKLKKRFRQAATA